MVKKFSPVPRACRHSRRLIYAIRCRTCGFKISVTNFESYGDTSAAGERNSGGNKRVNQNQFSLSGPALSLIRLRISRIVIQEFATMGAFRRRVPFDPASAL